MNRFIKTFVGKSLSEITDKATELAEKEKLTIISAMISFSGAGTVSEIPVLTVVFERESKARRPRKKSEEVSEE